MFVLLSFLLPSLPPHLIIALSPESLTDLFSSSPFHLSLQISLSLQTRSVAVPPTRSTRRRRPLLPTITTLPLLPRQGPSTLPTQNIMDLEEEDRSPSQPSP